MLCKTLFNSTCYFITVYSFKWIAILLGRVYNQVELFDCYFNRIVNDVSKSIDEIKLFTHTIK